MHTHGNKKVEKYKDKHIYTWNRDHEGTNVYKKSKCKINLYTQCNIENTFP